MQRSVNNTDKEVHHQTLLQGFINQCSNDGEKIAIYCANDQKLTYEGLKQNAQKVAALLQSNGVKPHDCIAVSLPRGKDLVIAILGILWSGCTYIPISDKQPLHRRESIYLQANIKTCITYKSSLASQLTNYQNLFIEDISSKNEDIPPFDIQLDDSAYIIFTSGSTGLPKGVEITHLSAWNTIQDTIERFEFTNQDITIGISAIDFDLSVFDIFGTLSIGGSLVVLSNDLEKEPMQWLELIEKYKVTTWNSVPALLEMLLVSCKNEKSLESLRIALISGDRILPSLYKLYKENTTSARFIALGGATEASIWSNYFEVNKVEENWTLIPYGLPLANQQYRIIHEDKDTLNHEVGELWIGGLGLAKSYVGQAELTDQAFIYEDGKRWYKTGDLGYYDNDNNIIFVGRKDNQVKINGYRIELGEIENQLSTLPLIKQATALIHHSDKKNTLVTALEIEKNNIELASFIDEINATTFNQNQVEDCSVHNFIIDILNEIKAYDFNNLPIESQNIILLWQKFIGQNTQKVTISDQTLYQLLSQKKQKFINILLGQELPLILLDDQDLAPSKLMVTNGMLEKINDIAHSIINQVTTSKITIGLPFVGDGQILYTLLEKLGNFKNQVKIIVFDRSTSLLKQAKQRCDTLGFEIEYVQTTYEYIQSNYASSIDHLIVVNGLHQYTNLLNGLSWIKMILKKDGVMNVIETEKLTAIGLVSAVMLEAGFMHYEKNRKNSSMLQGNQWVDLLNQFGFKGSVYCHIDHNMVYICTSNDENSLLNDIEIKEIISQKLVHYMIPEKICYIMHKPLTANGKVNQKEILKYFSLENDIQGILPQSNIEKEIAQIWQELLAIENIYMEDNFFEIGGDSLLATRLLNMLRNNYGVSITMREIFDASILTVLSKMVEERIDDIDLEEGEL